MTSSDPRPEEQAMAELDLARFVDALRALEDMVFEAAEWHDTGADGDILALRLDAARNKAVEIVTDLLAQRDRLRAALREMLFDWQYIRKHHGDLCGVGWDRCEERVRAALADGGQS